MRILLIHNQLWAHYKSKLFFEIYRNLQEKHPESRFLVAHIALHETSRSQMTDDSFQYDYHYKVLYNKSLEEVSFWARLSALVKVFNEFRPTILNVTGYFDWAQVLLMVYAKIKGVKIVLSSESSSVDNSRSAFKEKIKSLILALPNVFFCFGKSSADYLLSLKVKPSQIAVNNAAVVDEEIIRANYDQAKADPEIRSDIFGKHSFVYVGRLAPEKNLEMLLRAFNNIKAGSNTDSWALVFVGDGPSRTTLENLVQELALQGKVKFAGGWPWHKVPQWLAKSDVLILPSLSEPWGLVVNEAMVCGMPVIVSKKCGCADDLVENGQNGFVFDPEHQNELENALLYFTQNIDKIEVMGRHSQRLVQRFVSKNVATEMLQSYAGLQSKYIQ